FHRSALAGPERPGQGNPFPLADEHPRLRIVDLPAQGESAGFGPGFARAVLKYETHGNGPGRIVDAKLRLRKSGAHLATAAVQPRRIPFANRAPLHAHSIDSVAAQMRAELIFVEHVVDPFMLRMRLFLELAGLQKHR